MAKERRAKAKSRRHTARRLDRAPARRRGTVEGRGDRFDLECFLPYRLSVTTNRISRALARRYSAAFGLSIPEWRVIAVLGSYAPLSSNEIGQRTEMDKAKVSRAVTRLVSAGLLTRRPNPEDQRLIKLSLTRKGRDVYQGVVPLARDLERQLTAVLGADERRLLERALAKLHDRFGEESD